MPRRNKPSTITLLLPSPSSSSSTSTSTNKPTIPPTPDLEVLILAKKLANEKGQKFDITSYLNSDQSEEYRIKYLGLPPKPPPEPAAETQPPSQSNEEVSIPPPNEPLEIVGENTTTPSTPIIEDLPQPSTPQHGLDTSTPTPGDSTISTPIKKILKIPDLSHLHWKQRAKRLAEYQREAEMIANGELPESTLPTQEEINNSNSLNASTSSLPGGGGSGKKGELNEKDKESIRGSASYWNSLLISARKSRGPQWDYSLQQYQYDKRSSEYYNHGKDPRPITPSPKLDDNKRGMTDENDEIEDGGDINGSPNKKRKLSLSNNFNGDGRVDGGEDELQRQRSKSNSITHQTPNSSTHSLPKQSPLNGVNQQQSISITRATPTPTPPTRNPSLPMINNQSSLTPQQQQLLLQQQQQQQRINAQQQQNQQSNQNQNQNQNQTGHIQPSQLFGGIGIGRPTLNQNNSSSSSSIPQLTPNQGQNLSSIQGQSIQGINPNFLANLQQFQQHQQKISQAQSQQNQSSNQQSIQLGFNPQFLNGLNPQQIQSLQSLNPQQIKSLSSLNPQQLGIQNLSSNGIGLNPQQQINGLNPQQLLGLSNMMSSSNSNQNTNTNQFLQLQLSNLHHQQQQQQQGGQGGLSQHGLNQNLGMLSGFNNPSQNIQNNNNSGGGGGGGPMLGGGGNGNWSDFNTS